MTHDEFKTLNDNSAMNTYGRFDVVLEHGSGATAYDVNGKEYIDFGSGIGVNSLGYANKGWVDAITAQASKIQHTSNLYYNTATAKLTDMLVNLTGFSRAFMCNSGAEANECAIKLARKYSYDKYGDGRNEILTLTNSFHGRTMQTLTATGQDVLHPECFAPYVGGYSYCAPNIDDFDKSINDNTCAVMMEMIQGEGGVVPLDKDFASHVCKTAKERDILIIIDEVQTGIARTGKLLCAEHFGIKADITTLAKGLGGGLPIGACLCGEKCKDTMIPGSHGSTFGGNPVVCAGATYVLQTVADKQFLSDVTAKGEYIRNSLKGCKNILSVRGIGMMIGIEVDGKAGADVAKKCIENGLIVLTAKKLVRLLPPLNISQAELEKGVQILIDAIEE